MKQLIGASQARPPSTASCMCVKIQDRYFCLVSPKTQWKCATQVKNVVLFTVNVFLQGWQLEKHRLPMHVTCTWIPIPYIKPSPARAGAGAGATAHALGCQSLKRHRTQYEKCFCQAALAKEQRQQWRQGGSSGQGSVHFYLKASEANCLSGPHQLYGVK